VPLRRLRLPVLYAALALVAAALIGPAVASAETSDEVLARRPFTPTDRALFVPEIYPDAPALQSPAAVEPSESEAGSMLDAYLAAEWPGDSGRQRAARALFDDAAVKARIPQPALRGAFASLKGTFADGALTYVMTEQTSGGQPKVLATWGITENNNIAQVNAAPGGEQMTIVFDQDLKGENPFLFARLWVHEMIHLHDGTAGTDYAVAPTAEEAAAVTFDSVFLIRQLARHPELATVGTAVARRNNSNVLLRLNSGTGSALGLYATTGNRLLFPGSPLEYHSFWERFSSNSDTGATNPGTDVLAVYLQSTHEPGAPTCSPAQFSKALLDCIDANRNLGLTSDELVAAANALKLDTGTPSGPGGTLDTTAPVAILSGGTRQKLGGAVLVGVSCDEACGATATGRLRAGKKAFKLRKASKSVAAGARVTLKLKLPGTARKAAKRALKRHRKVRAKLSVAVVDAAGNGAREQRSVKLARG
jgi:hypothetical protein